MTFDPMKFYEDGQRKQKRYDSLVPVFVVAVVLLVAFGAAFIAYQRTHSKPKPAVAEVFDLQSGDSLWKHCNAWLDVKDLKDCPKETPVSHVEGDSEWDLGTTDTGRPRKHKRNHYRGVYGTSGGGWLVKGASIDPNWYMPFNPHGHVTMQELKHMQDRGHDCILAINAECWVTLDPEPNWKSDPAYNPLAHDGDMGSHADYFVPHFIQCPTKDCLPDPSAETPPAGYTKLDEWDTGHVITFNCGAGNCIKGEPTPPAKPSCKMPADIDVCPVQMLDPKAVDDKKVKP